MFQKGEIADFERMLDVMLERATAEAASAAVQIESEFAARGTLTSSMTPQAIERRLTPIHEDALAQTMRLLVQFSERTGISITALIEAARPRLVRLSFVMTERVATAANRIRLPQIAAESRARFGQRLDNFLADVSIGFIQGRSAIVTENSTNQGKALQLLQALYDATRAQTEPVFVHNVPSGLSEEDAKVAWSYLKDRGLIETYSIPYTAKINAAGTDAIEGARRRPDQPSTNFPSVSYNIVNNTMHVGTMQNSPVQQGGMWSAQSQTVPYNNNDLADLSRLVTEFMAHVDELPLGGPQRRKADAQIATLKAQLGDEPDPVIIKQAGRSLRNITEGVIASLLATAAQQPSTWAWVQETMHRLF